MTPRTTTRIANRARALRKAMTSPEIILWSRLKGRGTDKPVFRRQYPYASMIFDFYCPAARLAVEIDGSSHWDDEQQARDHARDRWLASRGIVVLRIGASRVYRNLGAVADAVILRAEELIRDRSSRAALALSTARSAASGPPLPLAGEESCLEVFAPRW